ncbi:MAG: hypothetical protein IT557_08010 [Alphaproteobacteria bacterium]|nr:hypothetical protein [Alphaproteobacteria bacterium]
MDHGKLFAFLGAAMALALLWPVVTRGRRQDEPGALQSMLIWAAIIAVVVILYAAVTGGL